MGKLLDKVIKNVGDKKDAATAERDFAVKKVSAYITSLDKDIIVKKVEYGMELYLYGCRICYFDVCFGGLKGLWKSRVKSEVEKGIEALVSSFKNYGLDFRMLKNLNVQDEGVPSCEGCHFFDGGTGGTVNEHCGFPLYGTYACRCGSWENEYPFLSGIVKPQSEIVEALARKWHDGQFRRDGKTPYITHPEAVVELLKRDGAGDFEIAVAWGHDLKENTEITDDDFVKAGVNAVVLEGINVLTRMKDEDYLDYVKEAIWNPLTKSVKVADILVNMTDAPTEKQKEKYVKALMYIASVGEMKDIGG